MTLKKIDKTKISHSMVAFVDLLGFSDRVKAIETLEDLAEVQVQVRKVQTWFGNKPRERFEREEARLLSKSVLAFSDCVVVAVSTHSDLAKMQGGFDVLMGELSSFAYLPPRLSRHEVLLGFAEWQARGYVRHAGRRASTVLDTYFERLSRSRGHPRHRHRPDPTRHRH